MRTATLAMIVVAGSAIAFQAAAQQQKAAPSEQTKEEMHGDVDKGLKTSEPNEQMQREADKGVKTRNSVENPVTWPIKTSRALLRILRADREVSRRRARVARPALQNRAISARVDGELRRRGRLDRAARSD
ncbi:hypothetical protein [Bradyrhizobium sp. LB13.1]